MVPVLLVLIAPVILAKPDRPTETKPKDTWVGKIVFVRNSNAELDPAPAPRALPPNADEGVYLTSNQYRVFAERSEYLQIKTREGMLGWVKKTEFVPLEDAVAFFSKQIEGNSNNTTAYHRRASAWRFKGEYDAALRDMNEALRLSADAATYNNRGLVWHAKEDYERAIEDFSKAIELSRGSALQHVNLANVYLAIKDYDRAIADASQALRLHPAYPEAHRVRAIGLLKKKEYDKAIDDFNRTLEIDAKHADAFAERAAAWAGKKNFAKALADFEASLRLEPANVAALSAAAFFLATCPDQKVRDGKRAMDLARKAQQLERNNSSAMQALAAAHAELGQFAEAVRWQEQALLDRRLKGDADAHALLESYRKKRTLRGD
jgi:tetratricopeptide (TPR) repeat protein